MKADEDSPTETCCQVMSRKLCNGIMARKLIAVGFWLFLNGLVLSVVLLNKSDLRHRLEAGEHANPIMFFAVWTTTFILFIRAAFMDPGYLPDALEAKLRAEKTDGRNEDTKADLLPSRAPPPPPPPKGDCDEKETTLDLLAKDEDEDFTGEKREKIMQETHRAEKLCGVASWTYHKYNPEEIEPMPARFCNTCDMWQSLRSKHCVSCMKCVARYDHHCIWIGNCVGERSHGLFWWYLLFQSVTVAWGLYEIASAIKRHGYSSDAGDAIEEFIVSSGFTLLVFCFVLLWAWLPMLLLSYHSFLLWTNQTTWEFNRKTRITYLNGLKPGTRPFDSGVLANIRLLCCTPKLLRWRSHIAPGQRIGGTEEAKLDSGSKSPPPRKSGEKEGSSCCVQ